MTTFLAIIALTILIVCVLYTLILKGVSKVFKVTRFSLARATGIVLLQIVVSALCLVIGELSGHQGVSAILGFIIFGVGAYVLFRKYTGITVKKFIPLWVVYLIVSTVCGVVLVLGIRNVIAIPFLVSGNSMAPEYVSGDYLIVERWDTDVRVGDVIIANVPVEDGTDYYRIARVLGMSGDEVRGVTVPANMYYIAAGNPEASDGPILVGKKSILGKPLVNLGSIEF